MPISEKKLQQLHDFMQRLNILEEDLKETFIQGSGKGGQKLHKTSSCVCLTHLPSGLQVKCQKDRSREINRFLARRALCELYEETFSSEKSKKQKAIEKIRKQKKRRRRKSVSKCSDDPSP